MGNIAHTYALITSLFENGEDYLDCFWPLAISVLNKDVHKNLEHIQEELKASSALEIPIHVLKTLMDRANKKLYVEKQKYSYWLTPKGTHYLDTLQTQSDVERQINSLIEDARVFFAQNAVTVSHENLYNLFLTFISHNIAPLTEFLNSNDPILNLTSSSSTQDEILLVKYLELAEKQKPEYFQSFAKMLLGSILSSIMYTEDPLQTQGIIYRRFQHCQIFLDTNFLLSVLGLLRPERNTAANELLALIKKHKCPLKVFDFTVGEMCSVISEYTRDSSMYTSTVQVDSLSSTLKMLGWTKSTAIEYIANIDEILQEKGISVETTGITLKNYVPSNVQHRQIMSSYKPSASQSVLNHDLAAIEIIRKIRRRSVRRIEDAVAIFLSSDAALSRFDFREMGHKEDGTVAEVTLDRLLTNILWLKDPHVKLSLSSIIAAHSSGLIVNRAIWERFYLVLSELVKQGKTKESDVLALLYNSQSNIEEALVDLDIKDINTITPSFALNQIEKARQRIDQDRDKAVQQVKEVKDAEFTVLVRQEILRQEYEDRMKWIATLQEFRSNFLASATREAKLVTTTIRILMSFVFVAVPLIFYLHTHDWVIFDRVVAGLGLLGLIATSGMSNIGHIWKAIENKFTNLFYRQKIKESGIEKNVPK